MPTQVGQLTTPCPYFPTSAQDNQTKPSFSHSALTHFNSTTLSNTLTAFHDILPDQEITLSCTAHLVLS